MPGHREVLSAGPDQRRFGLAFLEKADHRIDQHQSEDHAGSDPFAQEDGADAGSDQHQHERLNQLRQEAGERTFAAPAAWPVGATGPQPRRGVGFVKALARVNFQMVCYPERFLGMPSSLCGFTCVTVSRVAGDPADW